MSEDQMEKFKQKLSDLLTRDRELKRQVKTGEIKESDYIDWLVEEKYK